VVKDKGLQVENKSKNAKVLAFEKKMPLLSIHTKGRMRFHLLTFPACLLTSEQAERERERHDNFTSWQSSAY